MMRFLSGSGKSTLASQFEALYPNYYVRVNQDALGTRKKCEDLTRIALNSVRVCTMPIFAWMY
jgi:predicted ABC-type ATPase